MWPALKLALPKEENSENIENTGEAAVAQTANHDRTDEAVEEIVIRDESDDDTYDDEADCVVCTKEYGEFICCSLCPRAYHIECHVPELKKMPE